MHYLKSASRLYKEFIQILRTKRRNSRNIAVLEGSGLVDRAWYLEMNPDVASAGIDPVVHYYYWGAREGRDPSPGFDSDWYWSQNPDVFKAGLNPLLHYVLFGRGEGRQPIAPAALYDPERQSATTPDKSIKPRQEHHLANPNGARLLMIDSIYPRPDRDSGSNDTLNFIKLFLEYGFQVDFYADCEKGENPASRKSLEKLGVYCITPKDYTNLEEYLYLEGPSLALAFLCRVHTGGRHYEAVRRYCPDAKVVFDTVDLHFLREEREASVNGNATAFTRAQETREREFYLMRQVDLTIVVSKYEQELILRELPWVNVANIPLIRECPGKKNGYAKREGVAFIGGFSHKPNLDAVDYFLKEIWPLVRKQEPNINFYLIGSDLPSYYAEIKDDHIKPIGYVKDLTEWLEKIRITIAPLRYGAGAKGKIVSSLTHAIPCVATSIAAEGVGLQDRVNILLADRPSAFARQLVELYTEQPLWEKLSAEGYRFAKAEFSFDEGRKRIAQLLNDLGFAGPSQPGDPHTGLARHKRKAP